MKVADFGTTIFGAVLFLTIMSFQSCALIIVESDCKKVACKKETVSDLDRSTGRVPRIGR